MEVILVVLPLLREIYQYFHTVLSGTTEEVSQKSSTVRNSSPIYREKVPYTPTYAWMCGNGVVKLPIPHHIRTQVSQCPEIQKRRGDDLW